MTKREIQDYKDRRNLKHGFNANWSAGFDEAINLLANKQEKLTFEDWYKSKGYVKTEGKDEYRSGMVTSNEYNLRHSYNKYINL